MPASIVWNRQPLPPSRFAPLPLTAVRPEGWLRVRIQAEQPLTDEDCLLAAATLGDAALEREALEKARVYLDTEPQDCLQNARWLIGYHSISGDKRVPLALLRAFKALYEALPEHPLDVRQAADISQTLQTALWLYNITGQKKLLELCKQLKAQAPDWTSTLHVFAQTRPVAVPPSPDEDAYWRVHGATLAAGFKTAAMQALFEGGLKNETAFAAGWAKLTRSHGAAHGLFNADPLLAGANPSRAMDAQVVAQMLDTLPALLWALGDVACGDVLEAAAFNALPAAVGAQYANQLCAGTDKPLVGWSRFGAALWMASADDGLAAAAYAPCQVRWRVRGQAVRLEVETNYPAEETVRVRVHVKAPLTFPMHLRIPAWAEGARWRVGESEEAVPAGRFARVEREWQDGDVLTLTLPMAVRAVRRYHQSLCVERGPLAYALPVQSGTQWNLALLETRGFQAAMEGDTPVVYAYGAPVAQWGQSGDVPSAPPVAPAVSPDSVRLVRLLPYGALPARIAQFPVGVERA